MPTMKLRSLNERLLVHVVQVRKRKARARRQAWLGPTPPFYIDRPTSDSRVHTGLVFEKVTIPDNESGTSYTEKVLRRSGVVPILYYCDGVPLMSEGGGTPPIKPYLLHTIREERSPVDNGQVQDDINIRTENEVASQKEHSIEHMEQGSEGSVTLCTKLQLLVHCGHRE